MLDACNVAMHPGRCVWSSLTQPPRIPRPESAQAASAEWRGSASSWMRRGCGLAPLVSSLEWAWWKRQGPRTSRSTLSRAFRPWSSTPQPASAWPGHEPSAATTAATPGAESNRQPLAWYGPRRNACRMAERVPTESEGRDFFTRFERHDVGSTGRRACRGHTCIEGSQSRFRSRRTRPAVSRSTRMNRRIHRTTFESAGSFAARLILAARHGSRMHDSGDSSMTRPGPRRVQYVPMAPRT
jgi:hypothetical protein